jgi:tripartite-type tricarboxylate transporter receptor subunit TctC
MASLKALDSSYAQRIELPTVPSIAAQAHPAADRIAALNAAINAATAELARSGALANLGIEPVTETPAQFKAYIAAEVKEGAELLKDAGFKPE